MNKLIFFCLFLLSLSFIAKPQQIPLNDQYLYNRYQISPTYAGLEDARLFIGYRNERINFPGSTLLNLFSLDAPVAKNMALGGIVVYDQTDVFKHLYASLSYTYSVKITEDQGLRFALWGGIYENTMDFSNNNLTYIIDDPVVMDKMNQRGTAINSGAGVLYNYKDFFFGIDIPALIESKLNYKTGNENSPYRLRRMYMAHTSYPFKIKDDWKIEPVGIVRYAPNMPLNWEFATKLIYQENYWFAANLRSSLDIGFGLGAQINNLLVVNYTYEYTFKNLGVYNAGTHEIGIGYYLGRKSNRNAMNNAYESKLIGKIDSLQKYTRKLQNDIRELQQNSDLKYQDRVEELEAQLQGMKSNMESVLTEMASIKEEQPDSAKTDTISSDIKTYYIVVESYKKLEKAVRGQDIWKRRGFNTHVVFKEETGWYHLYTNQTNDLQEALGKMNNLRTSKVPNAWVLIYK